MQLSEYNIFYEVLSLRVYSRTLRIWKQYSNLIVCVCVCVCDNIYIYIYIYILFRPNSVCVCVCV